MNEGKRNSNDRLANADSESSFTNIQSRKFPSEYSRKIEIKFVDGFFFASRFSIRLWQSYCHRDIVYVLNLKLQPYWATTDEPKINGMFSKYHVF